LDSGDYVFTDPPFAANINHSDPSVFWKFSFGDVTPDAQQSVCTLRCAPNTAPGRFRAARSSGRLAFPAYRSRERH
jgi:hypothetical protein